MVRRTKIEHMFSNIFSFYQIFLYFRPVTTKFLETCPIGVGDVATFIAHCKTKTTPVFSAKATFGVEELATFTAQRKFTVCTHHRDKSYPYGTHTNYFFSLQKLFFVQKFFV